VSHPKGETYSTNLFIWYGEHHLGRIDLKRSKGTLVVSANPPAGLITIQGPEFALRLTNSAGITTNVPTDHYAVEASYAHWRQSQETTVYSMQVGGCVFAPRLGTVELSCNQSGASFQVFNAENQLLEAGDLPASLLDVPQGNYKLIAWHHKNKHEQRLAVKAGITNNAQVEFLYGAALLQTEPPGATVVTADGQEWGVTPRSFPELTAGQWQFQLRLSGYSPVTAMLDVAAEQTNEFSTNLVSINYGPAMNAARQHLAAGDYDGAFNAAAEALQVKPNDPEATALQREAVGFRHVRQAESLGKRGDYIGADMELETALQSLPDNEEAKQLLADWKTREPEQREEMQQERLLRGKKLFDSVLAGVRDADLFESHELKTGKSVNEVKTAILDALKIRPEFRVRKSKSNIAETFEIEAMQELSTVLATSAGRRVCVIVGAQTRDDETDILFKVLEYKAEAVNKISIGALIGAPVEVKYVPIHPSKIPQMTDKLKAQIEEGQKMVTDRIQQAIGGEKKIRQP
jgi:tetratricopeptide (TPR) repeat protein